MIPSKKEKEYGTCKEGVSKVIQGTPSLIGGEMLYKEVINMFTDVQLETGRWVRKISSESYRGWKAFYHTTQWKRKRKEVLSRDHYSCQSCRQKGKYVKATTVHHKQHLRDVPELALTNDNLMSLCDECHEALHPEKHKKRFGFINREKW